MKQPTGELSRAAALTCAIVMTACDGGRHAQAGGHPTPNRDGDAAVGPIGTADAGGATTQATEKAIGRLEANGSIPILDRSEPTEVPIAAQAIGLGPDKNLWFTSGDALWRLTP